MMTESLKKLKKEFENWKKRDLLLVKFEHKVEVGFTQFHKIKTHEFKIYKLEWNL